MSYKLFKCMTKVDCTRGDYVHKRRRVWSTGVLQPCIETMASNVLLLDGIQWFEFGFSCYYHTPDSPVGA